MTLHCNSHDTMESGSNIQRHQIDSVNGILMAFKRFTFYRPVGMLCYLVQTDKNGLKVEQSISMNSHALERPYERQIVTDPKSRNISL